MVGWFGDVDDIQIVSNNASIIFHEKKGQNFCVSDGTDRTMIRDDSNGDQVFLRLLRAAAFRRSSARFIRFKRYKESKPANSLPCCPLRYGSLAEK